MKTEFKIFLNGDKKSINKAIEKLHHFFYDLEKENYNLKIKSDLE